MGWTLPAGGRCACLLLPLNVAATSGARSGTSRLGRGSIYELPQLFNVFLSRMSLVGPRPPLPGEAEKDANRVRRRLVVKPSLSGLRQVNGRSELSWSATPPHRIFDRATVMHVFMYGRSAQ